VDYSDGAEWGEMKRFMTEFAKKHYASEGLSRKISAELDRATFMLMSVLIGNDLDKLPHESVHEVIFCYCLRELPILIHEVFKFIIF
jgi:hypothetical protein